MSAALDRKARLSGHVWTIVPSLLADVRPPRAIGAARWSCTFVDPEIGEITLQGALQRESEQPRDLLIVLHGLGAHAGRHYCVRAANAALEHGWHALRVSVRGADRSGDDIHHAGLTADLEAVIDHPSLAPYSRIHLIGFSLGGHLMLRYLCDRPDPRVVAAVAVCTPLDLASTGRHLDTMWPHWYRNHLLRGLKQIYHVCEARGRARGDAARVASARTIREFDAAAIVPRFGFTDVDHYYTSQSALQFLGELKRPTLFVASTRDPMVPAEGLREQLSSAPAGMELRWIDAGGHPAFPGDLDLGLGGPRGLNAQVLRWLGSR